MLRLIRKGERKGKGRAQPIRGMQTLAGMWQFRRPFLPPPRAFDPSFLSPVRSKDALTIEQSAFSHEFSPDSQEPWFC